MQLIDMFTIVPTKDKMFCSRTPIAVVFLLQNKASSAAKPMLSWERNLNLK